MAKKKKNANPEPVKYTYREGFHSPVLPQVAGERIACLQHQNGGIVAPQQVVDDARPEHAVLHPHFEWRLEIAANEFHKIQARNLIVSIRVTENDPETRRPTTRIENVHVTHQTAGSGYVTVQTAFADEDMTNQVLNEARKAYLGLMRRYEHLAELASLHAAMKEHLLGD